MANIVVKDLYKTFQSPTGDEPNWILSGINLEMRGHEFVSLVGPSGCGKSTLLNIVAGIEPPTRGEAVVTDDDGAEARFGYVFQEPRLLPWRSVMRNMLYVQNDRSAATVAAAERYLEQVGLKGTRDMYPHQLSGGMQQRAGIARAFGIEPDVLLMDEPFSHLDAITARGLRQLLDEIWSSNKRLVLFVTHDVAEAVQLSDRVIVLERGGRIQADIRIDLPRPRRAADRAFATAQADLLDRLEQMAV